MVIEVDPALKRELYAALAMSGSTLKDWFVHSAEDYCSSGVQGSLFANIGRSPAPKPQDNSIPAEWSTNEVRAEAAE